MPFNLQSLTIAFALLFTFSSSLISQTTFDREIGIGGIFESIVADPVTNGLMAIGNSMPPNGSTPCIMRLDSLGQTISAATLGFGSDFFMPQALVRLFDGRSAFSGQVFVGPSPRALVGILDANGQPVVAKRLTQGSNSSYSRLMPTADNGLAAIGYTSATSGGFLASGIIVRYDDQLDTLWTRQIGLANHDVVFNGVVELPSGDLLVGGIFSNPNTLVAGALVVRLTASGSLVGAWQYTSTIAGCRGMVYAGGNTVLLAGPNAGGQLCMMAVDTTGAFLWGKTVSGYGNVLIGGLKPGDGNTVVVYGQHGPNNDIDGFQAAFSTTGNLAWAKKINLANNQTSFTSDFAPHPAGGYLWAVDIDPGIRLLRTTSQGNLSLACGLQAAVIGLASFTPTVAPFAPTVSGVGPATAYTLAGAPITISNTPMCLVVGTDPASLSESVLVHPQPMHTAAHIRPGGVLPAGDAQLWLHDLAGRRVGLQATRLGDGWQVERGGLPAGLYHFQIVAEGQCVASGKLWIAD